MLLGVTSLNSPANVAPMIPHRFLQDTSKYWNHILNIQNFKSLIKTDLHWYIPSEDVSWIKAKRKTSQAQGVYWLAGVLWSNTLYIVGD